MGDLTDDFSRSEFRCKCGCGRDNISMELVNRLQRLRTNYGHPIKVISGCRCIEHNRAVGGKPQSSHICEGKEGEAADIEVSGSHAMYELLKTIFDFRLFNRMEPCRKHLHVDISKTLPQDICDVEPVN